MKLQKLGGYASIVFVCALIAVVGIAAFTMPRLGLTLSGDGADPVKVMAAYEASPITFHVLRPFGILIAIVIVLITLALQERMRANAPNLMRLAVIAASVASALLLANTITGTLGLASITSAKDVSAYRAFRVMQDGLSSAGLNAWGWALLLMGWAAITTRALPRILSWLILVYGVVTIFQFAVVQIQSVSLLLFLISMMWLGVVLLRKQEPSPAQAHKTAS